MDDQFRNKYVVFAENENTDPFVIAVADSMDSAESLIRKCFEEIDDAYDYSITKVVENCIGLNDKTYSVIDGEVVENGLLDCDTLFEEVYNENFTLDIGADAEEEKERD